jgi:hypothetical protein
VREASWPFLHAILSLAVVVRRARPGTEGAREQFSRRRRDALTKLGSVSRGADGKTAALLAVSTVGSARCCCQRGRLRRRVSGAALGGDRMLSGAKVHSRK